MVIKGAVIQFNLGNKSVKSTPLQSARKNRPSITTLDYKVPEGNSKLRFYVYSVWDAKTAYEVRQVLFEELP